MLHQIESVYQGNLRTQAQHLASSNTIITDAPTDNNGKGEAFSPSDLVCVALGSCMMTIMGIVAERDQVNLEGVRWETTKIMASNPRRIAEIRIVFHFPKQLNLDEKYRQKLENAAHTCPVALSISSEIKQVIEFDYQS
jgi:uncharacterized OsmC-like protein